MTEKTRYSDEELAQLRGLGADPAVHTGVGLHQQIVQ